MITMFKLNCKPITGAYDSSLPALFAHFPKELRCHNKKLVYEQHRLDIRKFNFTVRNVEPWNSLPQHVIDSETIIEFEKNLDKHWKKQEIYYDNYKAKIHTKTKWIYINLSKASFGCKSGNRKRVRTGRRYSWGISPLHEPVLTKSHPLHVPQQSSTAGVSPPYSQYRVQLGYLPLTLTSDKGTAGVFPPYPPRYSRGISPLPIHISNCWVTAGDAKINNFSQQGHQWQLLHRSMPQYLRSLWYYNIPYHWECLRLFTYLLLNWVNILLCNILSYKLLIEGKLMYILDKQAYFWEHKPLTILHSCHSSYGPHRGFEQGKKHWSSPHKPQPIHPHQNILQIISIHHFTRHHGQPNHPSIW